MLYECIRHPGRLGPQRVCATALRDGLPHDQNICTCCEECVAVCLETPHGHGGTIQEEYNFTTKRCRVCGEDIARWL